MMDKTGKILIYNSGEIELKVSVDNDTLWLNAEDIAKLFDVQRPAIVKHIGNVYKTGELSKNLTCSILEQVAKDGKKRKKNYYNLDVIISVGYRVNSIRATQFRIWATNVLKKYIQKGYVLNSEKITVDRFIQLENDVKALKQDVNQLSKIKHDDLPLQGIFYAGQIYDAYAFVNGLLKNAKQNVILIDNYIDDSVLTLFSKYENLNFTIITRKISKQLKLDLEKYNSQYKNLKVKISNDYHDRFLIIDNQTYHIGASLKDLGKKIFAFSKLNIEVV